VAIWQAVKRFLGIFLIAHTQKLLFSSFW